MWEVNGCAASNLLPYGDYDQLPPRGVPGVTELWYLKFEFLIKYWFNIYRKVKKGDKTSYFNNMYL